MKLVAAVLLGAATVMMVTASPAAAETEVPSSQESVSLSSEDSGTPCEDITVSNDTVSGGCPLHLSSSGVVDAVYHNFFGEFVGARCVFTMHGALNGSGEGRLGATQISVTNPPSGGIDCTGTDPIRPCTETQAAGLGADHPANWHMRLVEEHSSGALWLDMRICLKGFNPFGSPMGGSVWFRLIDTPSNHPASLSTTDHRFRDAEVPLNQDAELTGGWAVEGDQFEVTH